MPADPRDDPVGVRAARMVLIEMWTLLAEHREALTLVGGSVPALLFGDDPDDPYVGTLDVDAVVDPQDVPEVAYRTIAEQLRHGGYRQDSQNAFRWYREVVVDGRAVEVELDLLAPATAAAGSRRRHERIEGEPLARRTPGAELVRDGYAVKVVEGTLPDGRRKRVEVRVATPAVLLVLKGIALAGRDKPKDAYDVDYVLGRVSIDAVGTELRGLSEMPLVRQALGNLRVAFASTEGEGPVAVEAYRRLPEGSDAANQARALAYTRVQRLLSVAGRAAEVG